MTSVNASTLAATTHSLNTTCAHLDGYERECGRRLAAMSAALDSMSEVWSGPLPTRLVGLCPGR